MLKTFVSKQIVALVNSFVVRLLVVSLCFKLVRLTIAQFTRMHFYKIIKYTYCQGSNVMQSVHKETKQSDRGLFSAITETSPY